MESVYYVLDISKLIYIYVVLNIILIDVFLFNFILKSFVIAS